MSDLATIWYFEPKYHRLACLETEAAATRLSEMQLELAIYFFAQLSPREDCIWVYFPEIPSVTRFWKNVEVASTIAEQNPELILFAAELVPFDWHASG